MSTPRPPQYIPACTGARWFLAGDEPLACASERLFQAPIADALTHVGQIALLRRLAGAPVKGENYFKADIRKGRVGPGQPGPRVEFD